ncbi:hypothetical protein K1W54_08565 [Micromonospora sp. CPCC 205371]|nr:hypothetical protein [Micromonospora sp. CPCC 205371]
MAGQCRRAGGDRGKGPLRSGVGGGDVTGDGHDELIVGAPFDDAFVECGRWKHHDVLGRDRWPLPPLVTAVGCTAFRCAATGEGAPGCRPQR